MVSVATHPVQCDAAWDPSTGTSIGDAEMSALLAAAGAAQATPSMTDAPREDTLRIELLVLDHATGATRVADTFFTVDPGMAADRICTFLNGGLNANSQVRIQVASLSAMICLHPNGNAFQTVWVHRELQSCGGMQPACVIYGAAQLPTWTLQVCRTFQSVVHNRHAVLKLSNIAVQRERKAFDACGVDWAQPGFA